MSKISIFQIEINQYWIFTIQCLVVDNLLLYYCFISYNHIVSELHGHNDIIICSRRRLSDYVCTKRLKILRLSCWNESETKIRIGWWLPVLWSPILLLHLLKGQIPNVMALGFCCGWNDAYSEYQNCKLSTNT